MRLLKLLCFVVAVFSFLALSTFAAHRALYTWGEGEVVLDKAVVVELGPGMPVSALAKKLENQRLVKSASIFELWVRLFSDYARYQAGLYRFYEKVSPRAIAQAMTSGAVYVPIELEIVIPEGFNMFQVADRLSGKGIGEREEIISLMTDAEFLEELKVPSSTVEGYLYPATYPFSKKPSAREAIARMVKVFWSKLPEDYEEKVRALGLSLADAVTFASLIELETAREEERAYVSEVIWNRLKSKSVLGIDASIIYGIVDYQGNIRRKHLRDKNNPYNTRIHAGLPPTPIGSPSIASLLAVLSPSNHGYYFYVLDPDGQGRHNFSKSIREHNNYVRKLVRAQRAASRP